MEKEIREILNNELVGNDINITDIILSYIKEKCFICWKSFYAEELSKAFCDTKPHTQLYMDICPICIDKFKFNKCFKCRIWVDGNRSYTIGTLDNVCCRYCIN